MDLSIIIVSYNSYNEIAANIESIYQWCRSCSFEIIIVNNNPEDNQISRLAYVGDNVRVIEAGANLGFARANNMGLSEAMGKYTLFINPDTLMLSDINALFGLLEADDKIGLIGALTKKCDYTILPSCWEYPTIKNWLSSNLLLNKFFPKIRCWGNFSMSYFDYKGNISVDWISGAFMLGRSEIVKKIGGFDESFFMFCEDIDICWRMKQAGYKIVFSDQACIIHKVGHSAKKMSRSKAKMMADSLSILWNKYYKSSDVKKLFIISYITSVARRLFWLLMYVFGLNRSHDLIDYYDTFISETSKYIKAV